MSSIAPAVWYRRLSVLVSLFAKEFCCWGAFVSQLSLSSLGGDTP